MSFLLNPFYLLLILLIVIYTGITLMTPPDPASLERFAISETNLRLLSLTVTIPFIVIWAIAFWGFVKLRDYTESIKRKGEGVHLHTIANGFMVLSIGLPVTTIFSSWITYLSRLHDPLVPSMTIIKNYLTLIIFIVTFTLIAKGSRALLGFINRKPSDRFYVIVTILIILLGVFYAVTALANPNKVEPSDITNRAIYYLSDVQIIFTVVLPYIYVWFMGFRSAYYINYFRNNVKGVIYKSALKYLSLGITFIVIASIATQILTASTSTIMNLNLAPLLALVYILLAVIGLGYVYMALGAKRLKRIEEV